MNNAITKAIARIESAAGLAKVFNNSGLRGVKFFNNGKFFYATFALNGTSVSVRFFQVGAGVDTFRANESSLNSGRLADCIEAFTNKVIATI